MQSKLQAGITNGYGASWVYGVGSNATTEGIAQSKDIGLVEVGNIVEGSASVDVGTTELDSAGGIEGGYCTGARYCEASSLGRGG